jgi:hypothetical protein
MGARPTDGEILILENFFIAPKSQDMGELGVLE